MERKVLKIPMPDKIGEICTTINYKGSEAYGCFCKGNLCNESSGLFESVILIQFMIVTLLYL